MHCSMNAFKQRLGLLIALSLVLGGQAELGGASRYNLLASCCHTMSRVLAWVEYISQIEDSAGRLRGSGSLQDDITNKVERLLPADKGTVYDLEGKVESLEEYKNVTSGVINNLVNKINSLTPVCKNTPIPSHARMH